MDKSDNTSFSDEFKIEDKRDIIDMEESLFEEEIKSIEEKIDVCDMEEALKKLEIPFDDIYCLNDGSYGYWTLLTSNLEEEHKLILEKLGFKSIYDDLWVMDVEGPEQIPKNRMIETVKYREEILWGRIVETVKRINEICLAEKGNFFKPTNETNYISSKLKGFIVEDNDKLKEFCECLYKYIIESSKKRIDDEFSEFGNRKFYNVCKELRNHYAHDREHGKKSQRHKKFKKIQNIFVSLIDKKLPMDEYDYIKVQIGLMKMCESWLNEITEFLISREE